jgi:hypothetical protein
MQVVDHGPASALVLIADTCYLPRASIEGFLFGVEELLVRAAFHDVRIADIQLPLLSTTLKMRRPLAACKAQLD